MRLFTPIIEMEIEYLRACEARHVTLRNSRHLTLLSGYAEDWIDSDKHASQGDFERHGSPFVKADFCSVFFVLSPCLHSPA